LFARIASIPDAATGGSSMARKIDYLARVVPLAALGCALSLGPAIAAAQTTDGFHSIQVFPVVVDSASFTQRFTFRNPNTLGVDVSPVYLPGTGTSQPSPLTCPSFNLPAGADRTFASLRAICPGLAAGSQFGMLYTYKLNAQNLPYSGFSRVANPQGNGFSVEAFAANEFTAADGSIAGLRRIASGPGNPAFQTNCFFGNMRDLPPAATATSEVVVSLYDANGAKLGSDLAVPLVPGQLTRLIDVFGAVGAPLGDHDNARMQYFESGDGEPGLLAFCTVQDNTSFGADFRIAKQEHPFDFELVGAQDDHAVRLGIEEQDGFGRVFELGAGAAAANTHLVYFKHPDWIECRLLDPLLDTAPTNNYGVEMRLVEADTGAVVAGGAGTQGFAQIYTGDKVDRNNGANTRYFLQVESNGLNTGSARPYRVQCGSGSGHTRVDLVAYKEALNRF
jgi:hypothetical protein